MNMMTKQKQIIAASFGFILREKRKLYEKAICLAGYEFGESDDDETAIAWTGMDVVINSFREPEALPCKGTEKPDSGKPVRALLLRRPPGGTR
jgi:hypothetical protein